MWILYLTISLLPSAGILEEVGGQTGVTYTLSLAGATGNLYFTEGPFPDQEHCQAHTFANPASGVGWSQSYRKCLLFPELPPPGAGWL